jgi:hypothetical protein
MQFINFVCQTMSSGSPQVLSLSFREHESTVALLRHGPYYIVVSSHALRVYLLVGPSLLEVALSHKGPDPTTEGTFAGGVVLDDLSTLTADATHPDGLPFAVFVRFG